MTASKACASPTAARWATPGSIGMLRRRWIKVRDYSNRWAPRVEEIDLTLDDPIEIMQPLWAVALALAVAPMSADQRSLLDPPLLALAESGFGLDALTYRNLERAREAFARRMCMLHQTYDLLLTPQLAVTAFEAGHEVPPGSNRTRWWEWSPFTYPFNLSQQPAATVPCGFTDDGLPVALQLVGNKFADALVLRAARAYEKAQAFIMPRADAEARPAQVAQQQTAK